MLGPGPQSPLWDHQSQAQSEWKQGPKTLPSPKSRGVSVGRESENLKGADCEAEYLKSHAVGVHGLIWNEGLGHKSWRKRSMTCGACWDKRPLRPCTPAGSG